MSKDPCFESFYLKSFERHQAKHPRVPLDEGHFRGLASAKWYLLTEAQRKSFDQNTTTQQRPAPHTSKNGN